MQQRIIFIFFVLISFTVRLYADKNSDTLAIKELLKKSAAEQRTNQPESYLFANEALRLSQEINFKAGIAGAYIRIGSILYTNGKIDTSRIIINNAYAIYKSLNNVRGLAGSCILLSYIYQSMGMKDSAFSILYTALEWNKMADDKEKAAQILINLGNLHLEYNNDSLALKNFQFALSNSESIHDSEGIISAWDGLGRYHLKLKEYDVALRYFHSVDSVSRLSGDSYSVAQNLTNIALCHEMFHDYLSAKQYYLLALKICTDLQMTNDMALGEYNLGNMYVLLHQPDSAIIHLNEAIRLGRVTNDPVRVANSYQVLAEAYSQRGEFSKSYEYQKNFSALSDSILNNEKIKQIAEMETKYETEKKEQEIILLNANNKARSAQRNIFIVGTILSLLLAAAIFIGLLKTNKEKKISESLLLNILPSEVAEELKQKGSADARLFNEVTVLFTDFKDFTRIAEKLSPSDLVTLLHGCFREFDDIITRHRVEKIKTIGDSYMCAGGLPVPNKSNAVDVLNAAFEIHDFIEKMKKDRLLKDLPAFEMRIGIHTGPVVAGIVGVKKFAYDIWGDTVNIASRMESSGEINKINISGVTYELVKNHFNCTYRGKIQAKNKGEIDMYFVERTLAS